MLSVSCDPILGSDLQVENHCFRIYSVKGRGDKQRMNWKRCGRKQSWHNFKVLSQYSPGGTEENHKTQVRIAGL
jgi:hypothetical protein